MYILSHDFSKIFINNGSNINPSPVHNPVAQFGNNRYAGVRLTVSMFCSTNVRFERPLFRLHNGDSFSSASDLCSLKATSFHHHSLGAVPYNCHDDIKLFSLKFTGLSFDCKVFNITRAESNSVTADLTFSARNPSLILLGRLFWISYLLHGKMYLCTEMFSFCHSGRRSWGLQREWSVQRHSCWGCSSWVTSEPCGAACARGATHHPCGAAAGQPKPRTGLPTFYGAVQVINMPCIVYYLVLENTWK